MVGGRSCQNQDRCHMRQVGAMRVHLRAFGLLCSPLLVGVAFAHAPLEQVTSTDIEHNLKLEKKMERAPSGLLEDDRQAIGQALHSEFIIHPFSPVRQGFADYETIRIEPVSNQSAQSPCNLRTVRLLV